MGQSIVLSEIKAEIPVHDEDPRNDHISDRSEQPDNDVHKHHKSQKKIDVKEDVDCVPSNVQSASQEALLYVFEDNEAVIKMIIKGRSPTMRHVSRTHRIALDWLFDRITLDSKIQIRYIDTKNQLADTLTKENSTCDEWKHLLCLFNISHFSSINSLKAVNTTTSHVHFRSVNLYKEFSYRLKVNKYGALTTSEWVSRHTERHAQQCVK